MKKLLVLLIVTFVSVGICFSQQDGCEGMHHGEENMHHGEHHKGMEGKAPHKEMMMGKDCHGGKHMGKDKHESHGMYCQNLLGCRKKLELTQDQISSIEKINSSLKKKIIRAESEIKIKKMEINEALKQKNPDFSAAKKKAKEMYEIKTQKKLDKIDAYEESYNTLTKEQKNKLSTIKCKPGKCKSHRKKMKKHGMHHKKHKKN